MYTRGKQQRVDYYNRFLDSIKTPWTKYRYDTELKYYLKDIDVQDPNSLISQELIDSPSKIRELEDHLIGYISYLQKEKQYSYSSVHVRLCAIYHFYTINRVNLNKAYISKFQDKRKKVMKDTAYSRKQIHQMLESSNLRQKVIVLLLASTGMRIGALHALELSHLKQIKVNSQHLYKITVYEMEQEEYYTFCTFECAAVIDEYLEFRKRFGEILKPDSPLIREEFDRNDIGKIRKPKHLSELTFPDIVDFILVQSGVKQVQPKKEGQHFRTLLQPIKRCHGFRKFYVTQMKLARVEWGDREYLTGHRYSRGLDENYDRTDEADRLQEYLKAIDLLTINEENRLRRTVEKLTIDTEKLSLLETEINNLKELIRR